MNLNFKNYGLENIPDDAFITIIGTVAAVANGLSRSFWGFLIDRMQFRVIFSVILWIQIGLGFSFKFIAHIKWLYFIWVVLTFFCLGGHFSMPPTTFARMYGPTTGGKVHGV